MKLHNPEVDGLRALAVVGVIAFHFFPDLFPSGFLGVDIFFVISGFVVTQSCLKRSSDPFGEFLRHFWIRRFWRVFPSLLSVVVVGLLMIVLVDPDPHSSLRTAFFGLVGLANVEQFTSKNDYFVEQVGLNGFTHLWSLGVEEQFYLVFPFLIFFSTKTKSRTLSTVLLLAPTAASAGAFYWLSATGRTSAAFYLFPFRLWQIGMGVVVAVLIQQLSTPRNRAIQIIKSIGVVVLCSQFLIDRPTAHIDSLIATTVTAIVVAATQTRQPNTSRAISFSAAIGQRSYSLYLFHWVVLVLFRLTVGTQGPHVLLALSLTIFLSELNFRSIENRFRKHRQKGFGFKTLIVGATSLLAVLLLVMVTGNNFLFTGHRQDDSALLPRLECIAEDSPRWLVGDSHANGYSNILSQAFNGDCIQLRDDTTGNFFLFHLVGSNIRTVVFMDTKPFLDALSVGKPQELWIVNYLQGFFQDQQDAYPSADWQIGSYARPDGTQIKDYVEAFNFRLEQYRTVLSRASEIGVKVYIEMPPPDFDWIGQGGLEWHDENQMCSTNWFSPGHQNRFSEICDSYRSPVTVARSIVESRRKHIAEGLVRLTDEFPNLQLIDPMDALCSSSTCSTHLQGVRIYEDDDHYSVEGESLIANQLLTLIK